MVGSWPRISDTKPGSLGEVNIKMQGRFAGAKLPWQVRSEGSGARGTHFDLMPGRGLAAADEHSSRVIGVRRSSSESLYFGDEAFDTGFGIEKVVDQAEQDRTLLPCCPLLR